MRLLSRIAVGGLYFALSFTGCANQCNPSGLTAIFTANSCPAVQTPPYYIYLSSGYPTAGGTGQVTRWDNNGNYLGTVFDYNRISNFLNPQGITSITLADGSMNLAVLGYDGTSGRIDTISSIGSNFSSYIVNSSAMTVGTRRISATASGGFLVSRATGIELFNSSKARVGAPQFSTSGTCTVTAGAGATELSIAGSNYVVGINSAVAPNNKLNLFNESTGACIVGASASGPAAAMVPVALAYSQANSLLYVLFYPQTGASTNAQVWSFQVTPSSISPGTLLFNDLGSDIAGPNAAPGSLSSGLSFIQSQGQSFLIVGTSNNSVIQLTFNGTLFSKLGTTPLIFQNSLARSVSDIFTALF